MHASSPKAFPRRSRFSVLTLTSDFMFVMSSDINVQEKSTLPGPVIGAFVKYSLITGKVSNLALAQEDYANPCSKNILMMIREVLLIAAVILSVYWMSVSLLRIRDYAKHSRMTRSNKYFLI